VGVWSRTKAFIVIEVISGPCFLTPCIPSRALAIYARWTAEGACPYVKYFSKLCNRDPAQSPSERESGFDLQSAVSFEAIADSAQRLEVTRMARIEFDFFPQTTHENINRAGGHEGTFFPHGVK
jgi:hypothetical protein